MSATAPAAPNAEGAPPRRTPPPAGSVGDGARNLRLLFGASLFLLGGAMQLGRVARDALFLSHFGPSVLAQMYVTAAICVAVPGLLYSFASDRWPRGRLVLATQVTFCLTFAFLGAALGGQAKWPVLVLYNFVELFCVLTLVQYLTLVGDCFSTREAKLVFPLLGAAAMLGAILMSLGSGVALKLRLLATQDLTLIAAGMTGASAALLGGILHLARARSAPRVSRGGALRGTGLWRDRHVQVIAALAIASTALICLVDFQFKAFSQAHFTVDGVLRADELGAFYGAFFGSLYLAAALLQVFVTGRLLERAGLAVTLLVFPCAILAGSGVLLAGWFSTFAAGLLLKGSDTFLRHGLYSSTSETLYLPLAPKARARAKALVDGVLQPASAALMGLLLSLLVARLGWRPEELAGVAIAGSGVWVALVLAAKRRYLESLLSGLRQTQVGLGGETEQALGGELELSLLRGALSSADVREVRAALELLHQHGARTECAGVLEPLAALLARPQPDVRARALRLLSGFPTAVPQDQVLKALADPAEEVCAAGVMAVAHRPELSPATLLPPLLEASSPRIRGGAAAGLLKAGVAAHQARSSAVLAALAESADERDRRAAAESLASLDLGSWRAALVGLLSDGSAAVQRLAIETAAQSPRAELVPVLIYLLGQESMRRPAGAALVRCGELAAPELGRALNDPRESLHVRRQLPAIMARVGGSEILEGLVEALGAPDRRLRRDVAIAAAFVAPRCGERVPEARVRELLDAELRRYLQYAAVLTDLEGVVRSAGEDALREALEDLLRWSRDIALCLMALIYPAEQIRSIRTSLTLADAALAANALEALSAVLSPADRRTLLPVFELPPKELLLAQPDAAVRHQSTEAWLREFLGSGDPWLMSVTLYTLADLGLPSVLEDVQPLVRHEDEAVREQAFRVLSCLLPKEALLAAGGHLLDDASGQVRRFVRELLEAGGAVEPQKPARVWAAARPRAAPRAHAAQPASASPAADALSRLAQVVRLAVWMRLEGHALVLQGLRARANLAPSDAGTGPVPLGGSSIFQRAVASRLLVLDDLEEVTEVEVGFLEQLGVAPPVARAVIPVASAGVLKGLLYVDDSQPMSNEQLEAALAAAAELGSTLAAA